MTHKTASILLLGLIVLCSGMMTFSANKFFEENIPETPHSAEGNIPPSPVVCEPFAYINTTDNVNYVNFNWTAIENCTYIVTRIFNDTRYSQYCQRGNYSTNDTSFTLELFPNNTRTYFYVTAINASGDSLPSNIVSAYAYRYTFFGFPPRPITLSFTRISSNEYNVSWQGGEWDDNTQMIFWYSETPFTQDQIPSEGIASEIHRYNPDSYFEVTWDNYMFITMYQNFTGYFAAQLTNSSWERTMSNLIYLNFTFTYEPKPNNSIAGLSLEFLTIFELSGIIILVKKFGKKTKRT